MRRRRKSRLHRLVAECKELQEHLGVVRLGTRRYRRSRVFVKMRQHAECRGCDGICCYAKSMNAEVTPSEFHTHPGRYKLQWHPARPWRSRWPWHKQADTGSDRFKRCRAFAWLAKKSNGACIYFNQKSGRCSIYATRPISCRGWFCGKGTPIDWTWDELHRREAQGAKKDQTHVENNAGDLVAREAIEDGPPDADRKSVDSLFRQIRRLHQESVRRSHSSR